MVSSQCRLAGEVHAGSSGDRCAVIRALKLDSDAIQIADVKAGRRLRLEQSTLITCSLSGALELRPQQDSAASFCKPGRSLPGMSA